MCNGQTLGFLRFNKMRDLIIFKDLKVIFDSRLIKNGAIKGLYEDIYDSSSELAITMKNLDFLKEFSTFEYMIFTKYTIYIKEGEEEKTRLRNLVLNREG